MDILKLIKKRKTIRRYKDKPIPKRILKKIIEAGIWASSLHGFQPWKFVVAKDEKSIKEIADKLIAKSKKIGTGANILLSSSADTVRRSKIIILIFNSKEFADLAGKFKKYYIKISKLSEISAISAAVQNMILVAESLGIGSCWLGTPLFCKREINKILKVEKEELVAILTLGYPAEKGKRSKRKPVSETVKYIE